MPEVIDENTDYTMRDEKKTKTAIPHAQVGS